MPRNPFIYSQVTNLGNIRMRVVQKRGVIEVNIWTEVAKAVGTTVSVNGKEDQSRDCPNPTVAGMAMAERKLVTKGHY